MADNDKIKRPAAPSVGIGKKPKGKPKDKSPERELSPTDLDHREQVIRNMREHGFHLTDEAVVEYMTLHYEALADGERKFGRPTKYHPDMDEYVISLGKRGYSMKQIASTLNVTYHTLWNWGQENPDFFHALARAREGAQHWWETIGQAALFSKDFNTFIWNKVITNRFRADYTERKGLPYDPKAPDETEKIDSGVVQLDLAALTDEQREALMLAIEGTTPEEDE